jgi:hypothetical protein
MKPRSFAFVFARHVVMRKAVGAPQRVVVGLARVCVSTSRSKARRGHITTNISATTTATRTQSDARAGMAR